MRHNLARLARAALLAFAVSVAFAFVNPAEAQYLARYIGASFTSNAGSGLNGFACRVNGCRVDLGTGATDYLYSTGTLHTGGDLVLGTGNGNLAAAAVFLNNIPWGALAMPTCVAGGEGQMLRQTATGGTGTGLQTRWCACVSDGGAVPVYSWRNVISGTAGNSTTCNP